MGPLGVREPHVLKPDISAWQGCTAACVPAPRPEKLPATNVNWHICEVICFCFYFVFSKEVLTKESLACFHQSHVHFNASFGVCWAGAESCTGRNRTYSAIVSLDASSLSLPTIAGDTAESSGKAQPGQFPSAQQDHVSVSCAGCIWLCCRYKSILTGFL